MIAWYELMLLRQDKDFHLWFPSFCTPPWPTVSRSTAVFLLSHFFSAPYLSNFPPKCFLGWTNVPSLLIVLLYYLTHTTDSLYFVGKILLIFSQRDSLHKEKKRKKKHFMQNFILRGWERCLKDFLIAVYLSPLILIVHDEQFTFHFVENIFFLPVDS